MEKIINIDDVVWMFEADVDFIDFTRQIFDENEAVTEVEDQLKKPETVAECESYINRYCGNLEFIN